jgi:hypothetical protein
MVRVAGILQDFAPDLRSYLQALAKIEPEVDIPIHYADCWESMLIKRFQEMFQVEATPARLSHEFLSTPKFGHCEKNSANFVFSAKLRAYSPRLLDKRKESRM